jgi:hypothetical protein
LKKNAASFYKVDRITLKINLISGIVNVRNNNNYNNNNNITSLIPVSKHYILSYAFSETAVT